MHLCLLGASSTSGSRGGTNTEVHYFASFGFNISLLVALLALPLAGSRPSSFCEFCLDDGASLPFIFLGAPRSRARAISIRPWTIVYATLRLVMSSGRVLLPDSGYSVLASLRRAYHIRARLSTTPRDGRVMQLVPRHLVVMVLSSRMRQSMQLMGSVHKVFIFLRVHANILS